MADVYVTFTGGSDQGDESDGPFYLANTAAWAAVCRWAESGGGAVVRALAETGASADTAALAADLSDAAAPPGVRATLAALAELVGVGDADESAVIGDGESDDESAESLPESDDVDLGDDDERFGLIADILGGVFGDDALSLFDAGDSDDTAESVLWEWDAAHHPRGKNGRFISKGGAEAMQTASDKIAGALKGDRDADSHKELTEHLNLLTVKQLRELKAKYQLKASGNRDALVAKLADRLDRGRREKAKAEPEAQPETPPQPAAEPTADTYDPAAIYNVGSRVPFRDPAVAARAKELRDALADGQPALGDALDFYHDGVLHTPEEKAEFARLIQANGGTVPDAQPETAAKQGAGADTPATPQETATPSAVSRPSVDHGLLSPNGKMSKRARDAANERTRQELFGPDGLQHPQGPEQPSEAESLRRHAAQLRELASRGMKPRAYAAKADELERQAAELEQRANAGTGTPAAPPTHTPASVAGMYDRAGDATVPQADFDAAVNAVGTMTKPQLAELAKGMDYVIDPRDSVAKTRAELARRMTDRRGAAIRRGLIKPSEATQDKWAAQSAAADAQFDALKSHAASYRTLYDSAGSDTPPTDAAIDAALEPLHAMPKADVLSVAQMAGVNARLASKAAAIEALRQRVAQRRDTKARVGLGIEKPATAQESPKKSEDSDASPLTASQPGSSIPSESGTSPGGQSGGKAMSDHELSRDVYAKSHREQWERTTAGQLATAQWVLKTEEEKLAREIASGVDPRKYEWNRQQVAKAKGDLERLSSRTYDPASAEADRMQDIETAIEDGDDVPAEFVAEWEAWKASQQAKGKKPPAYTRQEKEWMDEPRSNRGKSYR